MTRIKPGVQFKHWNCVLHFGQYGNGRLAIVLLDAANPDRAEPIATATTNLVSSDLPPGHVFIKDWSENEGMADALVKAGIVELTGRMVPTGYVQAKEAKLLVEVTQ